MLAEIPLSPMKPVPLRKAACSKRAEAQEQRKRSAALRVCFSGMETREELVWENWELGQEYSKTLTLKNVHSKKQKLIYRPPVTEVFTTQHPHSITLNPGMSFSMPITFCPLEKCNYYDRIEFQSTAVTFQVFLRALIPVHNLEMPETVTVPHCAVCDTTQTSFKVQNASKLKTRFRWEVKSPFQIYPVQGVVRPGKDCVITVVFKPQWALQYQEEACCFFGDKGERCCSVLLSGLSKYPHIQLRASGTEDGFSVLDFGTVAVGCTKEKQFEVFNASKLVSTPFTLTLQQRPALVEPVFHCEMDEGRVGPESCKLVPITFSPKSVDCTTVDYYTLSCAKDVSKATLKVIGTSTGPLVYLDVSVLDFGLVELGEEVVRTVEIRNSATAAEAHFQFDIDTTGHSVFHLDHSYGSLPGNSWLTLNMRFRPQQAISYYRRVVCLVLHREPLFLDLIGTCHSRQLKPTILTPNHLHLYRIHLARDLVRNPPDMLGAMLSKDELQLDQEGALFPVGDSGENPTMAEDFMLETSPMEEYFEDILEDSKTNTSPYITVEPLELLFYDEPCCQYVSITNHTKGWIILFWTSNPDSPFSISPASCKLAPLKSTCFTVTYTPTQENTIHTAQLEGFALYQVLRGLRDVEDHMLCPPWCVVVRVTGHSFQPGCEHFVPRLTVQQPLVVFPAVDELAFKTVLFQNFGDQPLSFRLNPLQCLSVAVKPSFGLIQPGGHQILTLMSAPYEGNEPKYFLSMELNATSKYTQELTVVSVAEKPKIAFEGEGTLFFKPTAVGSYSRRSCWMKNMGSLPISFQWCIESADQQVISVKPEHGILQPNEMQVQEWSFMPQEKMRYKLRPSVVLQTAMRSGSIKSHIAVKVVGLAVQGSIQAESPIVDLGPILVGSSKTFDLPLLNNGSCDVSFSLHVLQSITGSDITEDVLALELDRFKETMSAQSTIPIRLMVKPYLRACYTWSISYRILSCNDLEVTGPQHLCQVQTEGVFPTLKVVNIWATGPAESLTKAQLWDLFSLNVLNDYLHHHPTSQEHKCGVLRPNYNSKFEGMNFDFCAAPIDSDPTKILLLLENPGSIPVEWLVLFPAEQQIVLEYWAETGHFSKDELHYMWVQDHKVFAVVPRSGCLKPGQQGAVTLTYRHKSTGCDHLPVLLKLFHGCEVLINLIGMTVEKDRPYLHFFSKKHTFNSVSIGGFQPPRQTYEVYNGGATPLIYQVDTNPLEELTTENFGHPILQCLTPSGQVQPGHTAQIQWIFSPLEAKLYSVDVPIHVLQGQSVLVHYEGCGLDIRESVPLQSNDRNLGVVSGHKAFAPCQLVFISEEWISLGDLPVGSRASRILFVSNNSDVENIFYTWSMTDKEHQQVVQINPARGELLAGESAMCILTVHVSGRPTVYVLNIVCQVTTLNAMVQYRQELEQREVQQQKMKDEFCITEDTEQASTKKELSSALQKRGALNKKFKPLPPIQSIFSSSLPSTCERCNRAGRRAHRDLPQNCVRPEPPRPILVHLAVTGRSYSLPEFQQRDLQSTWSQDYNSHLKISSLSCDPQMDLITDTITSIFRNLFDDPQFLKSLVDIASEPVPYFTQLQTPQPFHSDPATTKSALLNPSTQPSSSQEILPTRGTAEPEIATGLPTLLDEIRGAEEQQWKGEQEKIHRLPEVCDLAEDVLLNTLQNLMTEAALGELVLTAHPRAITLPPSSPRKSVCSLKSAMRDKGKGEEDRVPNSQL